MPVPITPETARLLTPEGRQEVLEKAGLPNLIAKLATLLAPDPMIPTPVGTMRFLDLAMRRSAPLARARMAKVLSDLGDAVPDRLWKFLDLHPQVVEIRSTPRLPGPPGPIGRIAGQTHFPSPPLQGPVAVTIHRRAPDRAGVLAHELAEAATGLAGKLDRPLPGLIETYLGHMPLYSRYGSRRMDAELFPTLFDKPDWVRIHRLDDTLQALREWFPVPPASPPVPGGW